MGLMNSNCMCVVLSKCAVADSKESYKLITAANSGNQDSNGMIGYLSNKDRHWSVNFCHLYLFLASVNAIFLECCFNSVENLEVLTLHLRT